MLVRTAAATALIVLLLPSCFTTGKSIGISIHAIPVAEYAIDDTTNDDVLALGVEAHILQFGPDLSIGYEKREISDADAEEVFLGTRIFLGDSQVISPYISARVRYSADGLDVPDSSSYTGYALGAGSYVWFRGPVYFDVSLVYEGLLDAPEVGGDTTGFEGVGSVIGIGIAF